MFDAASVGRRLRSGIADAGLSTDDFAAMIGSSRASVSDWMNGKAVMSFENALKVCDVLGWPLDRLAVRGDYDDQPNLERG